MQRALPHAEEAVSETIARGADQLFPIAAADVPRIHELMREYSDRGMDLADPL